LRLVTYDEDRPVGTKLEEVYEGLRSLLFHGEANAAPFDANALGEYSARSLAERLARLLAEVVSRRS
jgi:hypothetical protein